jgi:nicotinamidase-related amidase
MRALLVVDAQNEFSAGGRRPVPNHDAALEVIRGHVESTRAACGPIAWIQHFNRPTESPVFVPESWGAELSPGLGPQPGHGPEALFPKDVFGAFSAPGLEAWLGDLAVTEVLITGFYTHMCVSTTAREALVRGLEVTVDFDATGACALHHDLLGHQSADEVRRSALLQLASMGSSILRSVGPRDEQMSVAMWPERQPA